MTDKTLLKKANRIKELEEQMDILKAEQDALKGEIKAEMEERSATELEVGAWVLRYKEVVSNRVDSKMLKEKFEKVYGKVLKECRTMQFRIDKKKGVKVAQQSAG